MDWSPNATSDEDIDDTDYKPKRETKNRKRKIYFTPSNIQSEIINETDSNVSTSIDNSSTSSTNSSIRPFISLNNNSEKREDDDEPKAKKLAPCKPLINQENLPQQAVKEFKYLDYTLGLKLQISNSLDEMFTKPNDKIKKAKKNKENTNNNTDESATKFTFYLGNSYISFEPISSGLDTFEITNETNIYLYETIRDKRGYSIKSFNLIEYYLLLFNPNNLSVMVKLNENNELNRTIFYLASNKCLYLIKSLISLNISQNIFDLSLDVYLTDKLKESNLTIDPSECYKSIYSYYVNLIMTKFYFSLIDVKYKNQSSSELTDDINVKNLSVEEAKQNNENLFDLVYDIHSKDYGDQFKTDLDSNESRFILEKSNLKPMLRPYQINAVRWMLRRENFGLEKQLNKQKQSLFQDINNIDQIKEEPTCTSVDDNNDETDLHPLFVKIVNKSSQVIYYHKYLGLFTSQAPLKKDSLSGGILADEMGLGKTLEILSCILINPRTSFPLNEKLKPNEKIKKLNEKTFSCLCGRAPAFFRADFGDSSSQNNNEYEKEVYQCNLCGAWTHIDCVNYLGDRDSFLCLKCCTQVPPIASGCTLIVTPSVISHQWLDEIKKHVNSNLKVLFYTGCNQKFIQPIDLAKLDICITTYDVLSNELSHVFAIENMRQLRKTKRFMNVPSPLTCVEWWRICLDEAQMVHSTNSRCAEMASRLHAVNRWCVTGTPIGRSLADLHGLFTFIREDPYIEKKWFKAILYDPYINSDKMPLANAVSKVLWRTAKKYVEDQINIPEQTEKTYWLNFSPFELHLYERVLEFFRENRRSNFNRNHSDIDIQIQTDESSANVDAYFQMYNKDLRLDELERSIIDHIMVPLLDLRLACNHPQLVLQKKTFMPRGSKKEKLLSMEKSLQLLMKKTETECENFLRSVTFHSNAMAGLQIIKKNFDTAKQIYEKILTSEKDYDNNIRVDSLQKVHTLYNLIHLLNMDKEKHVERVIDLEEQLKSLEKKYTIAFDESKFAEETKLQKKTYEIDSELNANVREYQEWLLEILIMIEKSPIRSKEFWDRIGSEFHSQYIRTKISDNEIDDSSARFSYQIFNKSCVSYAELKQYLVSEFDNMIKQRKILIQKLNKFMNKNNRNGITDKMVKHAADCHLRDKIKKKSDKNSDVMPKCDLCECEEAFKDYSCIIFSNLEDAIKQTSNKADSDDEDDYNQLQRQYQQQINSTNDLERLNRIVLSYIKGFEDGTVGKKFIEHLTDLKEEFKLLRHYWIAVSNTINSYDELDMAKTRMRLLQPNEKKLSYTVEEHEVDAELIENQNNRQLSEIDLKKKYGQLIYLKSLIKTNQLGEDEENQEPCPICQNNLGYSWFILSCGHSYCNECHTGLVHSENEFMTQTYGSKSHGIRCALCRELSNKQEIYHVCTKKKLLADHENNKKEKKPRIVDQSYEDYTNDELANIKIKGNCNSAKVEGIVKCLLKIIKSDYKVKCLVFSEHVTMLELIQDLLKDNLIEYKFIKDNASFQKNIQEFKKNPTFNVLLLPYTFGANGLNIIEATHVLLVEPTLNRAQELQAIGRVHRIGQNKPTFVYRFVIRNTIEELVYNLFKSNDSYSKRVNKVDNTQPNCSAALAAIESVDNDHDDEYKKFKQRKIVRISDLKILFANL